MKKAISVFLAAILLLSLCACTLPKPEPTPNVRPTPPLPEITQLPEETPAPTGVPTPEPTAESTLDPTPEPTPEPTAEPISEPTMTPEPTAAPEDPDAALIADLEFYFNQPGMNGLLQTAYDDITELYLREVLYQMHDDEISYEEAREAYVAAFGEPEGDLSYMQDWSFDNFIWSVTGHTLEEFPDIAELPYDPASGLYFIQHGDTNFQPFQVLSIVHGEGSVVYVYYCCGSDWDNSWFFCTEEGGSFASEMLLTLTTETNLPCQFLPIRNQPTVLAEGFSW